MPWPTVMPADLSPSSPFNLNGMVAAVTGGASGIGRATALALAQAGAAVTIWDRSRAAAESVAAEIVAGNGCASTVTVDVTMEDEVACATEATIAANGRIDILVNSAGLAIRAPTVELPLADWNKVLAVNLTGVFLCARHVARAMIACGCGGSIINLASIMGLSGGGLYPNISYQATKGAIVNLTRALAVEWAPHNIRVNAVAPTWVNTPFIAPLLANPELVGRMKAMTPMARIAEPEDVTGAIVYLAGPASRMVTGHTLPVDGGFLAQ